MNWDIDYVNLFKALLVMLLLLVPPGMEFFRIVRNRFNSFVAILIFAVYLVATYYTKNLAPFIVVMFLIYYKLHVRHGSDERYYFRKLKGNKLKIFMLSVGFYFAMMIVAMIVNIILYTLGIELKPQDVSKEILNSNWNTTLVYVFLVVAIAPILEEYIFRHVFYRKLSMRMGNITAAVISSLLFTIPHFNVAGSVSFFGVGLFNCYLYENYGYRASVLNHIVFNSTSSIFMLGMKLLGLDLGI